MKTIIEQRGDRSRRDILVSQDVPYVGDDKHPKIPPDILWPVAMLSAMATAIFLLDAVLPLRDFWFHEATLTQLGAWPVWPSLLLFPGWALIAPVPFLHATGTPVVLQSWAKVPLLLVAFLMVFVVYLVAIRRLPRYISWRYLWRSTVVLGILYMLIPAVTSPDLYSYIAYARIGTLYHLNPLTTVPTAIHNDTIYRYVLWVDQPSAYGPTWAVITCFLQWSIALFGNTYVLPMVIALRVLGFALHLMSVRLIWSITGKMQQLNGRDSASAYRKRLLATLAFAWNPLLLFEACVNAHNDTVLLVLVLLVIWTLMQEKIGKMAASARVAPIGAGLSDQGGGKPRPYPTRSGSPYSYRVGAGLAPALEKRPSFLQSPPMRIAPTLYNWASRSCRIGAILAVALVVFPVKKLIVRIPPDMRAPVGAAALLALATCTKVNVVLLFPGLVFYVWMQSPTGRHFKLALATIATYAGVVVLFYLPFWQGGAIFNVFQVNPATYRTINTPADFLAHLYNSMAALFGYALGAPIGSPAERFMHTFSMGIFVLLYLVLLWRVQRAPWQMSTLQGLIRWMVVTWLLYCAIGSPWFWPWYIVTFFGLYALLEASDEDNEEKEPVALFPWKFWPLRTPWMARLLIFSMLSLYCFMTWGPVHSFIPGFPGFQWTFLGGLWAWLLPLAGAAWLIRLRFRTMGKKS